MCSGSYWYYSLAILGWTQRAVHGVSRVSVRLSNGIYESIYSLFLLFLSFFFFFYFLVFNCKCIPFTLELSLHSVFVLFGFLRLMALWLSCIIDSIFFLSSRKPERLCIVRVRSITDIITASLKFTYEELGQTASIVFQQLEVGYPHPQFAWI